MKKIKLIIIFGLLAMSINTFSQKAVSNIKITDIYGNFYNLYPDLLDQGKYVYIDFFYITCGGCQELAPIVDTVFRDLGCNSSDIVFLAIDYGATNEQVYEFTQTYNMSFPAISGQDGGGASAHNIMEIPYAPYTLFISPDGEILFDSPYITTAAELADTLSYWGFENTECEGNEMLRYEIFTSTDTILGVVDKETQTVEFVVPANTDLTTLIADFVISPNSVAYYGGTQQISAETENDFSGNPLVYSIFSETGNESLWTVNVQFTNSLSTLQSGNINIYPNPLKNNLNIDFSKFVSSESDALLTISDLTGKIYLQENIISKGEIIKKDLTFLSQGLYIVKINGVDFSFSEKISIQ